MGAAIALAIEAASMIPTLIDAGMDVWKLWDGVKAVNDEAGAPTDAQRQQLAELVKGLEARFDAAAKG